MSQRLGRKFVPALGDLLKSFTPFHTVVNWFLGKTFEEYYDASGDMHHFVDVCVDDTGENFQPSFTTSAFPGTRGTGLFTGIEGDSFNPKQGRYLPSATLQDDGYFWSSTSDTEKEVPNAPRNSGRRRNYKYLLPCGPFQREGKAMPIAHDFMAQNPTYGQDYSGFIPKGFSFSGQNFVSTSGSTSGVYLYELNNDFTYQGLVASSFFPVRGVPPYTDLDDFDVESASSLTVFRDFFGANIRRTLINYLVRKGKEDRRYLNFHEDQLTNFKFGKGMHRLFRDHVQTFERNLQNRVNWKHKYEGGFNTIAHAFGPILYNHDLAFKGRLQSESDKYAFEGKNLLTLSGDVPYWSAVAATPAAKLEVYAKADKQEQTILEANLARDSYGAYRDTLDILDFPGRTVFSNDSIVSGISLVAANTKSFAVFNQPNSPYNADFKGDNGITFFKRDKSRDPVDGVRVRYALDANLNKIINGDLQFSGRDDISKQDASLSAFAAWETADKNRTPGFNQFGVANTNSGEITVVTENPLSTSAVRVAEFVFSGGNETSGIGTLTNPSLLTIDSPRVASFPRNPDKVRIMNDYLFSLQASANSTDWTPYFAVLNTSRQEAWDYAASSWVSTSAMDTSAYPLIPMAVSGTQNTTEYQTWEYALNLSSDTGLLDYANDQLQIIVHPATNTTSAATARIKNIHLYAQSQRRNCLKPNRRYKGTVKARVALAGANTKQEVLAVRVRTHYRPLVGYGYTNLQRSFAYNFKKKFWEDVNHLEQDQWHYVTVSPGGSVEDTFEFSTENSRTEIFYRSADKEYFKTAGLVHEENTSYYIEVAKPIFTGELNAATLEEISLVDLEYAEAVKDFEKEDLQVIFDYFDELGDGDHSRSDYNSSSTFFVSGGSRSEYLEWYGGSHSAIDGVYIFTENE